jgi:hypothetical protein
LDEKTVSHQKLVDLYELLKAHPGSKSVILVFAGGSEESVLQCELTVNADDQLLALLSKKEYIIKSL